MVKEPHPGLVKTRLGRDLGHVKAAWWFRHQTRALINRLSKDRRWTTILAVSPDHEGFASRVWPINIARQAQGPGNLGQRMGRLLRTSSPGPVVIIGSDVPGITSQNIAKAFKALGTHDAVVGPAPDGGYWLIGVKNKRAVPRGLFNNVRWSTEHALADTLETFGDFRVKKIDVLQDIDTFDDLKTHTPA